ncbi:MAG: DUF4286 family protein [Myxococcus sp.]|nr:DUF4286 family protein [Myxococcus sp.]
MGIVYTVMAEFDDLAVASEWVHWLQHGHLAEVLAGGATHAMIVRVEPTDAQPLRFESRYRFASMAAFIEYETKWAPKLRAEGLAKFPPTRGVRMTRQLAEVLTERSA